MKTYIVTGKNYVVRLKADYCSKIDGEYQFFSKEKGFICSFDSTEVIVEKN